jgi:hypothetical protein
LFLNATSARLQAHEAFQCSAIVEEWGGEHQLMAFMQNTIVWITAANVLYLASYSVRDILWLRVLTVTAALLLIPYYAFQPIPLTVAIAWNVLFIAINTYWIIRLIIERRPVHLTPDEARSVILRGIAYFQHHGYKIAELGEGQFVGGIDRYAEPADMDVIVSKPVRTMCWARPHLTDFMANRPAVALALERSVGMEIQRLLDATLSALRD